MAPWDIQCDLSRGKDGLQFMSAQSLGIELLFLPPYSPNLNLIERFWKFVKKQCLYSKYYADHHAFEQASARASPRHRPTTASHWQAY